jgi:Proline racemase
MTSIAPFDYRLGVHLPDRVPDHDWRPANHYPGRFWKAWITGVSQYMLDPGDPWPSGYPAF